MTERAAFFVLTITILSTICQSGCSALDQPALPDLKRDVIKMDHPKFPDNYRLNFKVRYLDEGWWKEPQRTISAYMKTYGLIPEACKGKVEILDSGGTENQSFGWARFRCKSF